MEMEHQAPLLRVRSYVKAHDPSLEPLVFETPLATSEAAASALGVHVAQVAKSILFHADGRYGLFVWAGDRRVETRLVRATLGGKKPRVATPDEVLERTGFRVGAVCPFALATPLPVFIDGALRMHERVYTAAGVPESLLPITFDQLVRITGGTVLDPEAV